MRILPILFLILFSLGAFTEQKQPSFSFTYNITETLGFLLANKLLVGAEKDQVTYLPFHFDAQVRYSDSLDLAFGLVYRYENYGNTGPLESSKSGRVRPTVIWTNYHELFLLAGPQFNFGHGFYASIRGGLGLAISPVYYNFSALAQPEAGYSFNFGSPGFSLKLGLGVLLNLPFYENINFMVPWSKGYTKLSAMGIVVHQAIPIINVGLGFNL